MTPVLRLAAHLTIQGQIIVPDFGFYRAGFPRLAHP